MLNKFMKMSAAIVVFVLLFAFSVPAVSATDNWAPTPLQPQLSSDGNTLYNGIPVVVYKVDPNPPPNQAYIPPPASLLAGTENVTSTFTITYIASGGSDAWGQPCLAFPDNAKAAFNAAAAVWSNLLKSSVPITIKACWASLGSTTTLGYSGGGPLRRNFTGAPVANTWYTGSLANALYGSDLDPSSYDMHITYNTNFTWYYGTDGKPPSGQYDLMSVVLHEMGHGLGFAGSMVYTSGTGSYGYTSGSVTSPNIYDRFEKDGSGNLLTNTSVYSNPSTALGTALTSTSVWFHGTNAMAANGGTRVKLYAPSTWKTGSSNAHLDYSTFAGGANRLMVYAISDGVATHNPGPVAMGMLKDMGWSETNAKLYAYFSGSGLWVHDGITWSYLHSFNPATDKMAAGTNLYAYFSGAGLWKYDSSAWSYLHPSNPTSMVGGANLYAYFSGYGLYKSDGTTWTYLHPSNPASMKAGANFYAYFSGYGLYKYDGTTWTYLHPSNPASMTVGSNLYAYFSGAGLWKYNGSAWSSIHTSNPTSMVAGAKLYAYFNSYGLYKQDGTAWTYLHPSNPGSMTGGTNLYAYFSGAGLWQSDIAWSYIHPSSPANMAAGE